MAQVLKYKLAEAWSGQREIMEVEYDFAGDAGAVGALDIFQAKSAMVIHSCVAKVKTAATSGGAATVSLGVSGDAAGLMAATAVASLTAGAAIDSASFGSSYKLADEAVVQMSIATAALTAGKIVFHFEVSKF